MNVNSSKEKINARSAIIISIVSVVLGFAVSLVGPANIVLSLLPMALCAGLLAALVYFECEQFKPLRFIAPISIIVIDWIFNGFYSLGGIIVVVSALMIFLVYEQGWNKLDSAIGMSLVAAGLIALMFIAIGMQNDQGLSAIEFYKNFYEEFKTEYIAYFNEVYGQIYAEIGSEPPSIEYMDYVFDYMAGLLISILVVAGFILIGIACKVYSFVLKKCGSDAEKLEKWRFVPNSVYAYFYVIVEFLTMFTSTELTTFNLAVSNLSMIFMPIFWYMGIVAASKMISERKKRGMPVAFTMICAALISIVFPRILSYIGVFYCVIANKIKIIKDSDNE